jgi:hypothetical protein
MTQAEAIVRGFKFLCEDDEGVRYWQSGVFTASLVEHDRLVIAQTLTVYRNGVEVESHELTGTTRLQAKLLQSVKKSLAVGPLCRKGMLVTAPD